MPISDSPMVNPAASADHHNAAMLRSSSWSPWVRMISCNTAARGGWLFSTSCSSCAERFGVLPSCAEFMGCATGGGLFSYDTRGSRLFSAQTNLRRIQNRFREQARSHR
ncbi:hypothetical protein D3C86_1532380 [compost metagenome]